VTVGSIRAAALTELDVVTLYRLLELRVAVFVVEQACAYPELDGRDLEPTTVHLWTADDQGRPTAYLRILAEPDGGVRFGRIVTAPERRREGLAGALVDHALALTAPAPVVLDAQSHLTGWYAQRGFEVSGPEYLDDGIPHTPMRRERPSC
jgi:ElaA protein